MMGPGKVLIFAGLSLLVLGAMILLGSKLGLPAPGKLPGDLIYKSPRFTLHLPVTTCLAISVLLTALFYLLVRRSMPPPQAED